MKDKEIIIQLNQSIRDAEWTRDTTFMKKILSDDLLFRRANGSFSDKNTYLAGLQDLNNTYDHLQNIDLEVSINDTGNLATATLIVKASGKRGKEQKLFSGEFKNIRFFRKDNEWQLYAWYNEVASLITYVSSMEDKNINYKDNKEDNFCGIALIEELSGLPTSPHPRAVYVKFENGAFTKWHSHTGMQILLVKEGLGFVEQKGYPSFDMLPGDRIYIPENVWHRHGAKKDQRMVHMAFTNGETEWDKDDPCK